MHVGTKSIIFICESIYFIWLKFVAIIRISMENTWKLILTCLTFSIAIWPEIQNEKNIHTQKCALLRTSPWRSELSLVNSLYGETQGWNGIKKWHIKPNEEWSHYKITYRTETSLWSLWVIATMYNSAVQ